MIDFLLSPEGAKSVSMFFLTVIAGIYAMRFLLSVETREGILSWVRRHLHIAS